MVTISALIDNIPPLVAILSVTLAKTSATYSTHVAIPSVTLAVTSATYSAMWL